jgi:glycine/D-amino acid oxidase-like deaminating enzyme
MRADTDLPVVVAGAGLAGLAAGAAAAQAGARVIILESGLNGGRARTQKRDGFQFNQGPHALYLHGPGGRVLSRLGVRTHGHAPPLQTMRAMTAGASRPFPAAQYARVIAQMAPAIPHEWVGASTAEWIDLSGLRGDAAMLAAATVRLTTYVADLDRMPAGLAITQMQTALRGVSYLDGGWQQLVCGLAATASAAGAEIRQHARVEQIAGRPGAWEVDTTSEVIRAAAVVVAVGRPAAAARLLPAGPQWETPGPPVITACLDVGLRRPDTRFVLGIDEPLYKSPHAPPGDLAPAGCGLVHLMRYGATEPEADRDELWAFATATGIMRDEVVVDRFLPRMTVANYLPSPEQGLAGRPAVVIPGSPGLFIAGDWVGPEGWLADCSLASGERAGLLAARMASMGRDACTCTNPRVHLDGAARARRTGHRGDGHALVADR